MSAPIFSSFGGGGGSGGGGSVTSVALTAPASILSVSGSPVTTSGTLALSLAVQNANKVWAGPATGADAAPTFRALVSADIPSLSYVSSIGTFGSSPTANGASISGSTLTLQPADATNPGALTVAAQAITGVKTFASSPIITAATASTVALFNSSKGLISDSAITYNAAQHVIAFPMNTIGSSNGIKISNTLVSTYLNSADSISWDNAGGGTDFRMFWSNGGSIRSTLTMNTLYSEMVVISPDIDNQCILYTDNTDNRIRAGKTFKIDVNVNVTPIDVFSASLTGNVAVGVGSLATNATAGFIYIPSCAGTPTGTPTTIAGFAPMVVDSSNNKLYVYVGGSWVAMN